MPLLPVPIQSVPSLLGNTGAKAFLRKLVGISLENLPRSEREMPAISCCIVHGASSEKIRQKTCGPRDGAPRDAPWSVASEMSGECFLT